jgi:hypothetical protein
MLQQETTNHTGLVDLPIIGSSQDQAAYADFSIDDYGRQGTQRPYQIIEPAYPAPRFLGSFMGLKEALRECQTLCTLQGRPYRVVRWPRVGSARGGSPCKRCKGQKRTARFPSRNSGCLDGFPDATPIAEFHPNGQRIFFNKCGQAQLAGRPNYVVSHTPFPREYRPHPLPQRYLEAVKTGQLLARTSGRRTYICAGMGANCDGRNPKKWVPVVYVQPGGLVHRFDPTRSGTVGVSNVTPSMFRELVEESRGGTLLGQGA